MGLLDPRADEETNPMNWRSGWTTACYGKDVNEWPSIGCGCGFRPFANGPRVVLEVEGDGEWEAFPSECPPSIIDDMMKGIVWSKLDVAMKKMDPKAILGLATNEVAKDSSDHNGERYVYAGNCALPS